MYRTLVYHPVRIRSLCGIPASFACNWHPTSGSQFSLCNTASCSRTHYSHQGVGKVREHPLHCKQAMVHVGWKGVCAIFVKQPPLFCKYHTLWYWPWKFWKVFLIFSVSVQASHVELSSRRRIHNLYRMLWTFPQASHVGNICGTGYADCPTLFSQASHVS